MRKKENQKSSKRIRLEAYLGISVSMVGLAASSEAGIVTVDVSGFNGVNGGLAPGSFQNFTPLFNLGNLTYNGNNYPLNAGIGIFNGSYYNWGIIGRDFLEIAYNFYNGVGGRPTNISGGTLIDGTNSAYWGSSNVGTVFSGATTGPSPNFGSNSYLAFRVGSEEFSNDFYYGWIKVTWNSTNYTFQIDSMAYENSINTPILAGDTGGGGAVPEPASGAIAALLMGGTALRQWRKKRRDASNEAVAS